MPATKFETSILPDPTDAADVAAVAPDRADDLIASLADQQIDDLMSDGAEDARDADADHAIDDAMKAASGLVDAAGSIIASAAGDLKAELDEMEAARSTPTPAIEAMSADLPQLAAPNFDPAKPIEVPVVETPVEATASNTPAATIEAPPATSSDAEAVARELAADVAMLSTPLPSVIEHAASESRHEAWWRRPLRMIASVPSLILGAINLPVQPMSDRGREIVGAIGIMTLVNAAGLLIYVTMFARGH